MEANRRGEFELHGRSIHCIHQDNKHRITHFLPSGRYHERNAHGSNGQHPVHKKDAR